MKKILRPLLLTLVFVLLLLTLTACHYRVWSADEVNHWHSPMFAIPGLEAADLGAHTFGEPVTVPPTCAAAGSLTSVCTVCNYHKTETIPATGAHTYDEWETVYPTCGTGGWTHGICSCGAMISGLIAPTGEHDYTGGKTVLVTEGEVITLHKVCDVCDLKSDPIHFYSAEWSADADGHRHLPTCECEDAAPIGEAAHSATVTATVPPTCHRAGSRTYTCTVCDYAWEEVLPATDTLTSLSYTLEGGVLLHRAVCGGCLEEVTETVEDFHIVSDAASAQAALDAAGEGTVIYFAAADYGRLYLRTVKEASERHTSILPAGFLTVYHREISDLVLVADEGATFDAIVTESGSYTPARPHSLYPTESFASAVSLRGLTLSGLTFTGEETALYFEGYYEIDGLSVLDCRIIRETPLAGAMPYLLFCKTGAESISPSSSDRWSFVSSRRNITVRGCTADGIYQVIELRATENITLADNTMRSIGQRVFLFACDSGNYTGTVTITGNTVEGLGNRFLRFTAGQNVRLTLSGNTVSGYTGTDPDIVKITETTLSHIVHENNTYPAGAEVTLP